MKKSTQETIKESNIGLILKNIKENIYLSRIDLSKKTKLSRSAISNLVNFLIKEKIVFEGNKINSEYGKKPIELIFNKDLYYIIAINISTDNITVAIANLLGEIICIARKPNQPLNDKDHIIESIFTTVDEVLINSNINLEKIYLLSIGTHGVVNPLTKIVTRSPFFKNWNGINLINIFKERYKKEVILENYTDLAVVGEHWKSFNNLNNIVYLNIDYGIGAGIVINRRLVTGIKGTMGEISHLPILKNNNFKRLEQNKLELGLFESQVGIIGIVNKVKNEIMARFLLRVFVLILVNTTFK
ncbi:MAG: ROK family protein [Actinobacteria bacterium]|nr:ROK family protein [Actinomycetota bacterium]